MRLEPGLYIRKPDGSTEKIGDLDDARALQRLDAAEREYKVTLRAKEAVKNAVEEYRIEMEELYFEEKCKAERHAETPYTSAFNHEPWRVEKIKPRYVESFERWSARSLLLN